MSKAMTPPLPERQPSGYYEYTAEQLIEYGKACRAAALEEAAQICDGEQWHNSARPVDYIEAFNQGCEDCEAAIRRLNEV